MATTKKATGRITKVTIRMYRGGTGDFFILQFKHRNITTFQMMIDCGCIDASKEHFIERVTDLKTFTKGKIDLLVVTHEHADHINGFQYASAIFKDIQIKRAWFAWTEDKEDSFANDLRRNYSELDKAVAIAVDQLTTLSDEQYFDKLYAMEENGNFMADGRRHFIESLKALDDLNIAAKASSNKGKPKATMVDLLKKYQVIDEKTIVEFLSPGDIRSGLSGALGMRFYVLGPPRKRKYLDRVHSEDGNYEKRERPSQVDFALVSALAASVPTAATTTTHLPFDAVYEAAANDTIAQTTYANPSNKWRTIDHDWLFSAGQLALRYETSINNTSLALAIQFEQTERVLLFPGDAELGNWESWHDGLTWSVTIDGKMVKKGANYFLANTVFYKVGHHVSQNGTAKGKGVDLMTHDDLTVMATLDFRKIRKNWKNTMPNDLLCEALIKKSKGKFYFSGERETILPQIKTDRVTIKKADEKTIHQLNKPYDGEVFIECDIEG